MDIRKIALELSGKVAPDYKKYNRLEFMEYLEEIFWLSLDKIEFYRRQAKEYEEDFYFLILDLLYNKSLKDDNEKIKFDKLIQNINNQFLYNTISNLWNEWDIVKKETDKYKKWQSLEIFLEKLLSYISWFEIIERNLRLEDEEFDLVIKNNSTRPFIQNFNTPLILLEAKNWINKIEAKEFNAFKWKLSNHKNLVKLWIFVSMSWFTSWVSLSQIRANAAGENIIIITWEDIEDLINNNKNIDEWFETKIISWLK